MIWGNEKDNEYYKESATNYQGINNSPSKTTQQWVKELKWTTNFGVGLGGGDNRSVLFCQYGTGRTVGFETIHTGGVVLFFNVG